MLRWLAFALLLSGFAGCAKPDLPDLIVRAGSADELTVFRSELGERFTPEQLRPFDIALQELRLDAMNREVAGAAAREEDMQAAVNGKSVQETLALGWRARRKRLVGEVAQITELLNRDLKRQEETAGTPQSVITHIKNEEDILARLHRDLTETENQLTAWGASAAPINSTSRRKD